MLLAARLLRRHWIRLVLVCAAACALLLPFLFFHPQQTVVLQTASSQTQLEVATTPAQQAKGLGGRSSLAANRGMLFVLGRPTKQCLWMKDMQFSLDMAWLDTERKVVFVQPDVSPQTYPTAFCPDSPAKYVIELKAGQLAKLGVHIGQTLKF